LLQAIAEASPDELHTSLRSLQAAEFLYETRGFPDLEYTFKHALTHEVAYGSLLQDGRRTLHGRVLDAIENHHGHRLTEHIEALGYHALRSERWDKATVYLRLAGEKARARWSHFQAIDYLEQALRALAHLPDTADWQRTSIDLRLELRSSFYATGDLQRSITTLDAAERSATAIGDARRLAWVLVYQGENARIAGELSRARTCLDRAQSLAAGTNDQVLRALAVEYAGMVLYAIGEYRESIQCFRASAHTRRDLDSSAGERALPVSGRAEASRVITQTWLARSLAIVGEFEEAIALGRDALAAADCIQNPYAALLAALALGDIHRQRGDWIPATEALERAEHITAERGFRVMTVWVESRLGVVYVAAGDTARGLTLLRNAVANIGTATKDVRYSLAVRLLGEGCALAGDTAEARHCAKEAIAVARTLGLRGNEADSEWLLAHVCDAIGETQNAQQGFEASLTQASALGMRPLVAHCHLGLGKLYRRTGRREQAREHLATATTMYREMGMTYWLERTEAEESELA
jgi:tetratricopeptide (TPR) repeat protein